MGHSTQWTSRIADAPVAFPDVDWGFVLDESNVYHITEGGWEQEAGQYRDMADDTEAIRDYGLYAVFSNWSYLKNRSPRKGEWAKREITWISPIGGKRESYRVVGDYVLTQNDIENHVKHSDLTAPITWNIDIHFPDPDNEAKFKEPFRSCAYHRCFNGPYAMPYRCLYARDAKNLFLAGRDISCSHVAFAATRVMGTLGVCGEVTGMAAAICKKHGCMPRDVYEKHLEELKTMMKKGVPRPVFYHPGGCDGELEYYHLKADDRDERPQIYPKPSQFTPEQERKIRALGIRHRHEHPRLAANQEKHRRLVKNYPQPAGRNLFAVIPARTGGGYLAGCGYGGGLVRFNAEGEAVSQWFVPTDTGKESRFYAQVEERENGNIYLAHWTGHGENDSFKGWQVVEFDPSGKAIWNLDSPDRFGSISGVIVLED
jgi:hypothetical protein